ncbi:MAG: DUF2934 domain-containing protein [Solirubrobacteraceae bacterium]
MSCAAICWWSSRRASRRTSTPCPSASASSRPSASWTERIAGLRTSTLDHPSRNHTPATRRHRHEIVHQQARPARPARPRITSTLSPGLWSRPRRHQPITEAAYFRARRRGFGPGGDLDDWLTAEAAALAIGLPR